MLRRLFQQLRHRRVDAVERLARGDDCLALGDLPGAIDAYAAACAREPANADARNRLGLALQRAGRLAEAAAAFRASLALAPDETALRNNLGTALRLAGDLDGAANEYRAAAAQAPADVLSRFNLAVLEQKLGRADDAVRLLRGLLQEQPNQREIALALAQAVNFSSSFDDPSSIEVYRAAAAALVDGVDPLPRDASRPSGPLRVGYLSPDFRNHPVMHFIEPVLAAHDGRVVTVFCYDDTERPDAWTARLDALPVTRRRVAGMDDAALAGRIAGDSLDLLVDLAGLTTGGRPGVLARRPARVQAGYLGYLNTSGLAALDWRITDRVADPPGTAEHYYTERLAYLPGCQWLVRAPLDAGECTPSPCESNGWPTLGAAHNFAKVNSGVLAAWAAAAAAVPGSRVALAGVPDGSTRGRVLDAFAAAGVAAERVSLHPGMPRADYYRFLSTLDVALDAFPYTGGTTTCDALWMGVPVVTLAGRHGSARSGASLLTAAGMQHCVAQSLPEYVEICARLCADREALSRTRASLRQRLAGSPLTDVRGFVTGLEALYRDIAAE